MTCSPLRYKEPLRISSLDRDRRSSSRATAQPGSSGYSGTTSDLQVAETERLNRRVLRGLNVIFRNPSGPPETSATAATHRLVQVLSVATRDCTHWHQQLYRGLEREHSALKESYRRVRTIGTELDDYGASVTVLTGRNHALGCVQFVDEGRYHATSDLGRHSFPPSQSRVVECRRPTASTTSQSTNALPICRVPDLWESAVQRVVPTLLTTMGDCPQVAPTKALPTSNETNKCWCISTSH